MENEQVVKFELAIDEAIKKAASHLDLDHIDGDGTDEQYSDAYEEIFHCTTCIVRNVMEIVWPSIEEYIDFLKEKAGLNNV